MHKIERRECLILAFPVQRRLIAELPAWHNVHMRFSSHAKVRRENEQVPAHQNRRSTRADHLVGCDSPTPPMLRGSKRASKRPGCRIKSKARSTSNERTRRIQRFSKHARYVCSWHKADMSQTSPNVRFRG